jgi:hypothetical protein
MRIHWREGSFGCAFLVMKSVIWFGAVCVALIIVTNSQAQGFVRENFALNNSALFPASTSPLWNLAVVNNPLSFAWTMPGEIPSSPDLPATKNFSAPTSSGKSISDRIGNTLPKFDYATGEIGFMYGKFSGKSSGESKQAYIIGEAGNDKTQIFVGASYEDTSVRLPHSRH